MHYTAIAETDVGIAKKTNQDSLIIKHGSYDAGEILMAIICDGMGGLSNGELASATVIRFFKEWFDKELPYELKQVDMQVIGGKWSLALKDLNMKIGEYGKKINNSLGTTFTGILCINENYVIVHVGDTRVYHLEEALNQLTEDQTFIAREIRRGTMTPEEAKTDKRKNMLLQCIGASDEVEPEVIFGKTQKGIYLLCSDGFRHEISADEIFEALKPSKMKDKKKMHSSVKYLIDEVKTRKEKDNISAILIKVE